MENASLELLERHLLEGMVKAASVQVMHDLVTVYTEIGEAHACCIL